MNAFSARARACALAALIALVVMPSAFAHAQTVLEGTTELSDFERQAFVCRGQGAQQEGILAVRGISDDVRNALRMGTSPNDDWCLFLTPRSLETSIHTGKPMRLGLLNPKFGYCLMNYVKELERNGYRVEIRSAVRSDADQSRLRAQGASGTEDSYHEYGLAVDMGIRDATGRETYEFAHQLIGDAWHTASGLRYMTLPYRASDRHHLQADKSGRCGLKSDGRPDLSGAAGGEQGGVQAVVERYRLAVNGEQTGADGGLFGGGLQQIFDTAFGTGEERYVEEEAGEEPSVAYRIGEFLGGNLFNNLEQQRDPQREPQVVTIYYYETTTGTTTTYTVIDADKTVLATSTESAGAAIAVATNGLDSYLVLQIDDPSAVPERGVTAVTERPTPDWGFGGSELPGTGDTFAGSGGGTGGFLDDAFGGSTFGNGGGGGQPVFGAIAQWLRNLFGGLFGAN